MIQRPLIVQVISQVKKSHVFEWMAVELSKHFDVCFLLLNDGASSFEEFLRIRKIEVIRVRYRGKRDLPGALYQCWKFLRNRQPSLVHAHLLEAQLAGLTAAWLAGIQNRVYTRHTSNYHQAYHPKGIWMDRWSNRLASKIVSISQATEKTLMQDEGVSPSKVASIPHGFDLIHFSNPSAERVELVRSKWNLQAGGPIVGVIGRHVEWKGIQYIVPAFKDFQSKFPGATLVLANAVGPYHDTLRTQLQGISPDAVRMIPFEEDIVALYRTFDLYVHTPVDEICEAFGQTYVEALAVGVPSIFTISGIAAEFVEHRKNALVVPFKDSAAIAAALEQLYLDKELQAQLVQEGKKSVAERFQLNQVLPRLVQLYNSLVSSR